MGMALVTLCVVNACQRTLRLHCTSCRTGPEKAFLHWSGKKFMLMLESRQWTSVAKNDGGTIIKSLNMLSLLLQHTCQRSRTSY